MMESFLNKIAGLHRIYFAVDFVNFFEEALL